MNDMQIPPLFKADSATLSFYASKDGKISVSFSGWDANRVVLEDQVFELSWGPHPMNQRESVRHGDETAALLTSEQGDGCLDFGVVTNRSCNRFQSNDRAAVSKEGR
jgi:hypothetical protein